MKRLIIIALAAAASFTLAAQTAAPAPAPAVKAPAAPAAKAVLKNTCKTPLEAVKALYKCMNDGNMEGTIVYSAGKAKKMAESIVKMMKAADAGDIKETMLCAMRLQGVPDEQLAAIGPMIDGKIQTMTPEEKKVAIDQINNGMTEMIKTMKAVKVEFGEVKQDGKFATVKVKATDPAGQMKDDMAYLAENNGIWYNIDKTDYDKATAKSVPVAAPAK